MSQDARVIAARQWWLESLAARAETLRAGLSARSGGEVAARAGAHWEEAQQRLTIPYWGKVYTVAWPTLAVYDAAGQPARPDVATILLSYLERADGEPAAGRWLSFRELPDAASIIRRSTAIRANAWPAPMGRRQSAWRRPARRRAVSRSPWGMWGSPS